MTEIKDADFSMSYSEESLWEKIKSQAAKVGKELIELVLTLYYCLMDNDTPHWARATIVGALIYFISPLDAIPDFLPGGYADDLLILVGAAAMVAAHIKPEHRKRAHDWVEDMLGSADSDSDEQPA